MQGNYTHVDIWYDVLYTLSYDGGNHKPPAGAYAWWVLNVGSPSCGVTRDEAVAAGVNGRGGQLSGPTASNSILITHNHTVHTHHPTFVLCLREPDPYTGVVGNVLHAHVEIGVHHFPPSPPPPLPPPPLPPPPAFSWYPTLLQGTWTASNQAAGNKQYWWYDFISNTYLASTIFMGGTNNAGHYTIVSGFDGNPPYRVKLVFGPNQYPGNLCDNEGTTYLCDPLKIVFDQTNADGNIVYIRESKSTLPSPPPSPTPPPLPPAPAGGFSPPPPIAPPSPPVPPVDLATMLNGTFFNAGVGLRYFSWNAGDNSYRVSSVSLSGPYDRGTIVFDPRVNFSLPRYRLIYTFGTTATYLGGVCDNEGSTHYCVPMRIVWDPVPPSTDNPVYTMQS